MEVSSSARPSSEHRSSDRRSRSGSRKSSRKQPSYDESALTIQLPSPLLTSSLHSRNSATSAQESTYLSRAVRLRWTRLALTLLILATSAAAMGCTGHVLRRYNATHFGTNVHLPLWPQNVDVRPTLAILISAAIAASASLLYLVFSLIPTVSSPHSWPRPKILRID